MMKKTAALLSLALSCGSAHAVKVADVDVPEKYTAGETELVLNGAGIRTKFFFDLYVGSLFVSQKMADHNAVINADEPMAIRLNIISDKITSDRMLGATKEGFDNATGGNTAPMQADIDNFLSSFNEKIVIGDQFDFVYLPGKGISISKNGKVVKTMGDLAFKKVVFAIWLGDKPAQDSLKDEMLGK